MVRTKICGIASVEDLEIAEKAGSDAVGFLVGQKHASNAFITVEQAEEWCRKAKPFVSTVVVTHLEDPDEIIELIHRIKPTTIQLHSDLSIQTLIYLKARIPGIKRIGKVSVCNASSVERALEIQPYVDAILLDTIDLENDKVGGTGLTHDWSLSRQIVEAVQIPVILAGGLNPENVKAAIELVKPWSVDVNSGVKIHGRNDVELVRQFVRRAKGG